MKKYIIIFSLFLSILCFNIDLAYASENTVHNIDIHVKVDYNGDAHINEVWNIDVYNGTEIYKIMNQIYESEIKDFYVVDDKGYMYKSMNQWDIQRSFDYKSYKCGIIQDEEHFELCFGIGDYGNRTYSLNYTITNFVKDYKDVQGIKSMIISDMSLPVENFNMTIELPYSIDKELSDIYGFGFKGIMSIDENKVIIKNTKPIILGEKVHFIMTFDDQLFENVYHSEVNINDVIRTLKRNSEYKKSEYMSDEYYNTFLMKQEYTMMMFIAGISLMGVTGLILLVSYIRYKGKLKDYIFNDNTTIQKENIKKNSEILDLHLFDIYYLSMITDILDETNRHNLIGSLMFDWINKDILVFNKIDESSYEISFNDIHFENGLERHLFNYLKEASGSNLLLEKDEFERWSLENYEKIDLWLDEVYQYVENKYKNNGLLCEESVHGKWLFKNVDVKRYVYDKQIKDNIYHMLGLKTFLENAQYKQEREQLSEKQWDQYLVYVYLFDLFDKIDSELETYDVAHHNNQGRFYHTKVVNTILESSKKIH